MKCRHFLLSVQALHAGYGGRTILKDVDIALASGEITALIGPNGSGKSTLLRCLCGEMLPLHGEILLEGLPLSRLSAKARARRIAVVPQRPEAPDIRASDMVLMGRYPHLPWHGFISSQDRRKTIAALRAAGASPLAERPVRTLSGGEFQRIMLARALAQEADVFLLDEPASAMDPARQTELFTLLAARAAEGAAILAVLHDINTALLYCDRIVALRSGQIFFSLTPSEVDASLVQVLFDTPFAELRHPCGLPQFSLTPLSSPLPIAEADA